MAQYFSNTFSLNCSLKVGESLDKIEAVKNIIENNNGIAKTADFVAEELSNYDVANLCKEVCIERVRHSYYRLAEQENMKEEQMLASLLPESIVCVESALFYFGYSDFAPRRWSIAVPRTFSRTKLRIDSLMPTGTDLCLSWPAGCTGNRSMPGILTCRLRKLCADTGRNRTAMNLARRR